MSEADPQAQVMARIAAAVDRALAVPVTVQLRGALEYGIASGLIPAGSQLPSVRALAAHLKVSPVTVSNAYAALRASGLIEGRVGAGSFVTPGASPTESELDVHRLLQSRIEDLVEAAEAIGLDRRELAMRVANARGRRRSLRILMLGIFPEATESYAAILRSHLPARDEVVAATLAQTREALPEGIDLVVTPRNVQAEAQRLFPAVPVVGMTFIPTEQTRIELARIAPEARVAIVSYFADFLALMRAGILRFAPHVSASEACLWDAPEVDAVLARCDVLIYATGAERLRERLHAGQGAIEYRHTPDPHAIRAELLPAVEARREAPTPTKDTSGEDSRQQLVRG
ncbi:GntR family transcriptional regulator [Aureimonas sp. AU4]|uniref:GntR family transcriptional regulator n=1 Tax=Aureimonas sp. AU4 TaxID=1638163 RepID=UPI000785E635|nr:GntR family transcriptional regulator [Aureimonas sp. AU4]